MGVIKMKTLATLISGFIVTILLVAVLLAADKQPVTFINSTPHSIIGLVVFETDEKGNPIGYVSLNLDWSDKKKTIMLEPDLYGATKFDPGLDRILEYRQFWVRDKPITINM